MHTLEDPELNFSKGKNNRESRIKVAVRIRPLLEWEI